MNIKICKLCGVEKDINDFHLNRKNHDGHNIICKECRVITSRKNYERNKIKIIVKEAIKRYKKQGMVCDPYEQLIEHINTLDNTKCECCGCELKTNDLNYQDDSIAIARIIPEDGFICENIAILCNTCNRIKSDATPDEIMAVINGMKESNLIHYGN